MLQGHQSYLSALSSPYKGKRLVSPFGQVVIDSQRRVGAQQRKALLAEKEVRDRTAALRHCECPRTGIKTALNNALVWQLMLTTRTKTRLARHPRRKSLRSSPRTLNEPLRFSAQLSRLLQTETFPQTSRLFGCKGVAHWDSNGTPLKRRSGKQLKIKRIAAISACLHGRCDGKCYGRR